jgi:hypothetical protein
MMAGAVLASAVLTVLTAAGYGGSAPAGGGPLTATAADLQKITGLPVEIQATSVISENPRLPVICRAIVNGFRDASADPVAHEWMGDLIHIVVIDGWKAGRQTGRVEFKDKVLTVKTMTGEAETDNLRRFVAETLKKVAHLKEKQGTIK